MKLLGVFLREKYHLFKCRSSRKRHLLASSHIVTKYNYADCNLNVLKREDSNNRISDAL